MVKERAVSGPSRFVKVLKRVLQVVAITIVLAAVVLTGANYVWKYSGTNKWRLVSDRDGVQIYSKKVPGDTLLEFRGHIRFPQSIGVAVYGMLDVHLEGCQEFFPGCTSVKPIETWNPKKMSQTYLWQVSFSKSMRPREFLLETKVLPEPSKKAVTVEFLAQPDILPRDACCKRIEHLDNTWRFTQVEPGQLDVVFTENMDLGFPYFMVNRNGPDIIREMLKGLPEQFNDPDYKGKWPEFLKGFDRPG